MTGVTPDLAGFHDAQVRLIDELGAEALFHIPASGAVAASFPDGTSVDPESGDPFDPTITASAAGASGTTASAMVAVVNRPVGLRGLQDAARLSPVGAVDESEMVLKLLARDWPRVQDATRVTVFDRMFSITQKQPDGIRDIEAYFIFCRDAG